MTDLPRKPGYIRVLCPGAGHPRIMPEGLCRVCGAEVEGDEDGNAVEHQRYEEVRYRR